VNKQLYHPKNHNGLPGGVTSDLSLPRWVPYMCNGPYALYAWCLTGPRRIHLGAYKSYEVDGILKEVAELMAAAKKDAGRRGKPCISVSAKSQDNLRLTTNSLHVPGCESPGFLLAIIMAEVVECISLAVRVPGGRHGQRRHQIRSVPRQQGWFPVAILSPLTVQFRRSRLFIKFNGKIL